MKIVSHKQLDVDDELIAICKKIQSENKTDKLWSEVESSDMFQSPKYCGGYESVEQEFCFSYFSEEDKEWWFQLSLDDVGMIVEGRLKYLDLFAPQ